MAAMGAACVASTGPGLLHGTAAAMTMYPDRPGLREVRAHGRRSLKYTFGEIGLGRHWLKLLLLLHHLFIYKAKAKPGWHLIPE